MPYVFEFAQGSKDMADLLGGKGANLAEMTNLGLPVPPGFTITTEACRYYLEHGREPDGLAAEVGRLLDEPAARAAQRLGADEAVRALHGGGLKPSERAADVVLSSIAARGD